MGEVEQGGYGAAAPGGMNMGPGGAGASAGAGGHGGGASQHRGSALGGAGARGSRLDAPSGSRAPFEAFQGTGHRLQD